MSVPAKLRRKAAIPSNFQSAWASLIAYEFKPYEFRKWPAPKGCFNQRIAIHAGARAIDRDEVIKLIDEVERDLPGTALKKKADTLDFLQRVLVSPGMLPRSSVVCTADLGRPQERIKLFDREVADSDRTDHHKWAWPLMRVDRLEPPAPASGKQGFWDWTPQAAGAMESAG
ncbi:MAG: hypothetical protein ACR2RF_07445 [Geminicoccaceae bacterium]